MKTKIIIFLFFLSKYMFSQEKVYYLNIDNQFKIEKTKDGKKVLQSYLIIKNNFEFNAYYFVVQTHFEEFDKSSKKLDFTNYEILNEKFYSINNPCELHEFFSNNRNVYLVFEKDGNYYGWPIFYEATSKNTVISINSNSKI